jgi:3-methylcrotonyl-CoA carboxylase beta subunit
VELNIILKFEFLTKYSRMQYSPRFLWMWPNAKVSVMGSAQLSQVMTTVSKCGAGLSPSIATDKYSKTYRDPTQHSSLQQEIEEQSTAIDSTARLWDDGIIKPTDTRDVVGLGLALVSREKSSGKGKASSTTWDGDGKGFGVFRM